MSWYYAVGQDKQGPVSEEDLNQLVQQGTVTNETLVWQDGMADWQPYGQAIAAASGGGTGAAGIICAECGNQFSFDDVIRFGDQYVCAGCKPIHVQRMQEGGVVASAMDYAGFWVRFAARFVDGIITGVINMLIGMVVGLAMGANSATPEEAVQAQLIGSLIGVIVGIAYEVFFIGRFGATPGKMALKLKVVRPDGDQVSYLRALGRWFAMQLSGLLLMIGYLMAAFDREEHRSLHDRICDTRVIRV